jgi:predicted acylesterase/phospholipase RssA
MVKLGLALGAGGARGLVHVGILKVLHKHGIKVDYIAGTSMGAVIGAAYAAGRNPIEIEKLVKSTNWKKIIDFTVPKHGLVEGVKMRKKLRELVYNFEFKELEIPLVVVSYNLTKRLPVYFHKGDVTQALRATISIPGIFNPVQIGTDMYIDGAVANPTPYDVVKEMGADIVIAVDIYQEKEGKIKAPIVREQTFLKDLKQKFVTEELAYFKDFLIPERWPRFIRKTLNWTFDKILYPARILRMLAGREMLPITKTMYKTVDILTRNLAKERLACAKIDILITPDFHNYRWSDFAHADKFIKIGEREMTKKMSELRKMLK